MATHAMDNEADLKKKPWFWRLRTRISSPKCGFRPTTWDFLAHFTFELFELLLVGMITLALSFIPITGARGTYFPYPMKGNSGGHMHLDSASDTVLNLSLPYMLHINIFTPILCAIVAIVPTMVVFAFFQIAVKSLWDFMAACMGLFKVAILSALWMVILKHFIGGLRPSFFHPSQCFPTGIAESGWYKVSTYCSEVDKNSLESFPSGHAMVMFACMVYLTLYMNAKWKILAYQRPRFLKLFLAQIPLIYAVVISSFVLRAHEHHVHDVVGGALIGTFLAVMVYRSNYCSVFNQSMNHVPLAAVSSKLHPTKNGENMFGQLPHADHHSTGLVASETWRQAYGESVRSNQAPRGSMETHHDGVNEQAEEPQETA